VSPALPAGLSIDSQTGVLSGTPTDVAASATYTVTASNTQGSTTTALTFGIQTGPTFQLQVTASGQAGDTLSYQWAATDGIIQNTDTATTTWTAPTGPGVHFVYVTVGNGKAGYAESRIAISTDFTGAQAFLPPATAYRVGPPSLGGGSSGSIQFFVVDAAHAPSIVNAGGWGVNVYSPALLKTLGEVLTWESSPVTADEKGGAAFLDGFPPSDVTTSWQTACNAPGAASPFGYGTDCGIPFGDTQTSWAYTSSTYPVIPLPNGLRTAIGHATLADGSPIGIRDPFFALNVTATASLMGCTSDPCFTVPVNAYGDFSLPLVNPISGNSLMIAAENVSTAAIAVPPGATTSGLVAGTLTLPGTSVPVITALTATFGSIAVSTFQNILPDTANVPSDHHPEPDTFLSFKGEDSRLSACYYYKAIRAVSDCDASGNMKGAISFEDWKRAVAIDQYAIGGAQTTMATYVNVVDLNLTREHHSIDYGPNQVGTYVCNHAGPTITIDLTANPLPPDQQTAVDNAIASAVAGKNLVACVAMDYVQDGTFQSGQSPTTRFLVFGPSGELLPSVNLDGRGEKFVPGTCVACHGADTYAGHFKADAFASPDIGAHFLPYDAGNFAFSSAKGFTKTDLQVAIKRLNQNILDTNVTPATSALVAGWYAGGRTTLDETYVPPDWKTYGSQNPSSNAQSLYQNVIARSCRTCHAALPSWNWDATPSTSGPVSPPVSPIVFGGPQGIKSFAQAVVCGGNPNRMLNMAMPNSLVTFDRFWNSAGTAVDQPAALRQFAGSASCQLQ
jgi:hypothetical protein